ncbi:MAG: hypothetical protein GXP26_16735 [Planctomycetes bacterium]|nr:hypothetical protein [Planctomycetota bacterium]
MAKKKKAVKKAATAKKKVARKRATVEAVTNNIAANSRKAILHLGTLAKNIDVQLSYKIVRLFSEGLYQSANKAFEELITNSFDAGATVVKVLLPSDPTDENAMIAIADNGSGMDSAIAQD